MMRFDNGSIYNERTPIMPVRLTSMTEFFGSFMSKYGNYGTRPENNSSVRNANLSSSEENSSTEVQAIDTDKSALPNEEIIYRAGKIHTAFIMSALAYMKEWKGVKVDENERIRNERLKRLGFTSSLSLKESNEKMEGSFRIKCFEWFTENFPGCIFLPTNDFIRLLRKYNLACGPLDFYKGNIPDENLEEILHTVETLERLKENNPYSNKKDENTFHRRISGFIKYRETFLFPEFGDVKEDEILPNKRFPFEGFMAQGYPYNISETYAKISSTDLFIAAPAQDMNQIVEISYRNIRSEDPFVFQLTPYGVVIFSKWGEEAEDEMFFA